MSATASTRPLKSQFERFCAWYRITRTVRLLQIVAFITLFVIALAMALNRLLFLTDSPSTLALWICIPGVLVLLGHMIFSARDHDKVSYLVDRSAGLRNLVASGLEVEGAEDDVSRVIESRARSVLEEKSPSKVIPVTLAWAGRYLYIPLAVLILSLFTPELDLLKRQKVAAEKEKELEITREAAARLTAKVTALKESSSTASTSISGKKITDDFNLMAEGLSESSKKEALVKLGEFENKYKKEFTEQREFETLAKAMDVEPDLSGLAEESQEALKDMIDAMKNGDMQQAANTLKDLAEQLGGQGLTDDQKQALAREMQKAVNQLKSDQGDTPGDQLAQTLDKMMQQAQQNAQDSSQQGDGSQQGSQQNSQSMQELAQQAASQMQDMSEMMDEMAKMQQMQEGMSQAKREMIGEQFNNFDSQATEEMMEREAQQQAQLGQQCPGGNCDKPGCDGGAGCEGNGTGMGKGNGNGGTGGAGKGKGGSPPEAPDQTAFVDEQSQSQVGEGRILQQIFVKGVPEKGEALVAYGELTKAAKSEAAGSLARDQIPREYEKMVKEYFDSIEPGNN